MEGECWLLLHALHEYSADVLDPRNNNSSVPTTFDMSVVSKEGPTGIAKTLLYMAICIQQLPSDFDPSRLQMTSRVDLYESKIISTIQPLVTSDDEIVSTLEGLECLVLQGIYHTNSGNPRRAWLSFRRAINIAQLMGLHKSNDVMLTGSKRLWYHIERADRYIVCFNVSLCREVLLTLSYRLFCYVYPKVRQAFLFAQRKTFRTQLWIRICFFHAN